ncbi:MAG: hypothetical protein HZB55_02420 [Deltaproteobacteria bacterium]|nr:hypothetical protein [Deltaproteobacteria bacterium]
MKRRLVWTLGVLLTGLLAAPAMAACDDAAAAAPAPQVEEQVAAPAEGVPADGAAVEAGTVPQAQIDIFNKREEARKRRDEALKVRQQMMQSGQ